jgi:hypothetical protein
VRRPEKSGRHRSDLERQLAVGALLRRTLFNGALDRQNAPTPKKCASRRHAATEAVAIAHASFGVIQKASFHGFQMSHSVPDWFLAEQQCNKRKVLVSALASLST